MVTDGDRACDRDPESALRREHLGGTGDATSCAPGDSPQVSRKTIPARDALADQFSKLATMFYKPTSSAIFLAMSSSESSSVLRPLREPRSGLIARISS